VFNLPPRDVPSDQGLTQIGTRRGFPKTLRKERNEDKLSLCMGRVPFVDVTVAAMFEREATKRDAIRHATAGCLQEQGFRVTYDDGERILHVSVEVDEEWSEDIGRRFDSCFGEPILATEQEVG
jgi:hypothetical protein